MIRAILWAQWRSLCHARIGSGRFAGIAALLAAALWYGVWTAAAIAIFRFSSDPGSAPLLAPLLARSLMLGFLYWQIAPVLTASVGASLDLRKLRLYPVPESRLFYVEAALRITTAVEILLLLAGLLLGVSWNPVWSGPASLERLALFVAILAFQLPFAAGLASMLDRLLSRKWVREAVLLVLLTVAVLPQFLVYTGQRLEGVERWLSTPPWPFWPWSAAAHIALSRGSLTDWAVIALSIGLASAFGRRQFHKGLMHDFQAAEAASRTSAKAAPRLARGVRNLLLRCFRDPLAVLVEKELLVLARSPRFRTVFLMGCTFGLIVWIPIAFRRGGDAPLASHFLTVACVYALTLMGQVTYWNVFGFDCGAARMYFLWPVPARTILIAKNLATAAFVAIETALVTGAALVFRIEVDPQRVGEALAATAVTGLYLVAAGNFCSVRLPRPISSDVLLRGAGTDRRQNFILLLTFPVALLPLAAAYLASYALGSDLAFYLVLAAGTLFGGATYSVTLNAAAGILEQQRESITDQLGRGTGPVMA